jgi:hypothetical protein
MAPAIAVLQEATVRTISARQSERSAREREAVRALAHKVGVEAVARALDVFGVIDQ